MEVLPADLRKRRAAARVADALAERGIAIDLLVNNAGIAGQGAFAAMDPDMLDDLVAAGCTLLVIAVAMRLWTS